MQQRRSVNTAACTRLFSRAFAHTGVDLCRADPRCALEVALLSRGSVLVDDLEVRLHKRALKQALGSE